MRAFTVIVGLLYWVSSSLAAPSCPMMEILQCVQNMNNMYSGAGGGTSLEDICSNIPSYLSCMEPYKDLLSSCSSDLADSYGFARTQWDNQLSSVCEMQGYYTPEPRGGSDQLVNMTEPLNETAVPDFAEYQCPKVMKCSDTNGSAALIPSGDLGSGYNFPSSYVSDYCRFSSEYLSCMSDPQILNDSACTEFTKYVGLQMDTFNLICSQEGQRDLEAIRQCINNVDLQRETMLYFAKVEGRVEGLLKCNDTDKTTITCNEIETGVEEVLRMVEEKCDLGVRSTIVRLLKSIVPWVYRDVPEASKFCPDLEDFIQRL